MTDRQRARAKQLNSQGYKPERIAQLLELDVSKVRSALVVGRKRGPRLKLTPDQRIARKHLRDIMKRKTHERRLAGVRCVIANFGPLLEMEMADAERVLEEWYKQ